MEKVSDTDKEFLIRDKYNGNRNVSLQADLERLESGEPLAYVIGHLPFLNLSIALDSRPLIPRPETEWWTEKLIKHIQEMEREVQVLDLCAGSGAIGLSIQKHCPLSSVYFGELYPEHSALIHKNAERNALSLPEDRVRTGDLFVPFVSEKFNIIATNPPYIPTTRTLEENVTRYEPSDALFSGNDGLSCVRHILEEAPRHLLPQGEVWMECDIENIETAAFIAKEHSAITTTIQNDLYGRPRILVAYYR